MSSPPERRPVEAAGILWVALGASLWGFDALFRAPLTGKLQPAEIVFYEHLILCFALTPFLLRDHREWRSLSRWQWAAVLWIGWGGSAFGTICYTHAVKLGNPTTAIVLQKLQPLLAVLLARLLLRERQPLRGFFWLRLAIALTGAYLMSFGASWQTDSLRDMRLQAALFAVAAAAIWGSCTVFGRYLTPTLSPLTLTSLRVISAVPLLTALVVANHPLMTLPAVETSQLQPLFLMALIPGLAGLLAYYRGLSRTPASLATLAELCFPASAAALNWVFLDAALSPAQMAGVVLLCWAVLTRRGLAQEA